MQWNSCFDTGGCQYCALLLWRFAFPFIFKPSCMVTETRQDMVSLASHTCSQMLSVDSLPADVHSSVHTPVAAAEAEVTKKRVYLTHVRKHHCVGIRISIHCGSFLRGLGENSKLSSVVRIITLSHGPCLIQEPAD